MVQILKYNPRERLCGPAFLKNAWFNELFIPETRRRNGQPITILNRSDYESAVSGDRNPGESHESQTGTKSVELTSDL